MVASWPTAHPRKRSIQLFCAACTAWKRSGWSPACGALPSSQFTAGISVEAHVMPALMIQGCGSDVGKSVLVAGLCRLLMNRGHRVRPFKPQNMSNNAAVTADGGEIGRSTALQAQACRVEPTVDMNPVLLKPQSDIGAQLIVQGKRIGTLNAKAHGRDKRHL